MNNKISRRQLAALAKQNLSGEQLFSMMINFYKKYDNKIADLLLSEDQHIHEMTGIHYMYDILAKFPIMYLHRPIYLFWETLCGEHDIFLKRKVANDYIQEYTHYCKKAGCKWPDNAGITDVVDYLNKWFAHYNEN